MRIINKEYLLNLTMINRDAYYDIDMEMAVFVNDKMIIRYYYFFTINMPKYFEVRL